MHPEPIQIISAIVFFLAIAHTFATRFFEHMAYKQPAHAGLWHLLGEVEVVFGFWALILVLMMFALLGADHATHYVDTRNFNEPLFVFAIMVMAATRPILHLVTQCTMSFARILPTSKSSSVFFSILFLIPLLGSLVTEPAAMTLAALILRDRFFARGMTTRMKYATLGTLFVNVSIGGTLTSFAAPPVLMVAEKWDWDLHFMLVHFGWKAAIAVLINTLIVTFWFRKELKNLPVSEHTQTEQHAPKTLTIIHVLFLIGIVVFAHHPAIFMGLLLFFLGIAHAYRRYQDRLILREGLLVAFFLAGLVVLGGQQQWWLQPLLMNMDSNAVFIGAMGLTAITDNAALTYLGSLVEGLSDEFKYALVAGAVTGGGLTVIANAPNPAGIAILRGHFEDTAVSPGRLLLYALIPTLVAALAFKLL
jgi:hypothetical protein